MAKINPLMALPLVIAAGFIALVTYGMAREDAEQLPSSQIGREAPSIASVTPFEGKEPLTDGMLREGGVKLVNYWASWCAPCRAEHPQLETLAKEGVTIYGINYKDEASNALKFLDDLGNPYTAIAQDEPGRTALEWGVYGVPETYILDAEGHIAYRFAGPITVEIMEKYIKPEIAKAAQ
ncbi:DsbE family thiol:disulfide interchange protein [Celeribacter halophilus]|uniref:Cytochrome c biogenesis protein CcmG, thiol:disulfide interchange protein DsbE n=1 Tax=Celeribacter halophilus TaxID=576117 RepID=A0A1I3PWE9_9RHOB|nr:DsbE family thiol:disulfide interchange protein [Celeribacter halophilus]PZX13932.1 cytochrome c biogenesis protein CcmG/thiol:disulfide interchange protein DsbE [Celeribacter halophilus]SFJ25256.1 cytochrome c biogenesis protein CcmG, thiol:disulfide interchange protein DsbE [Celeribacter halophilus]